MLYSISHAKLVDVWDFYLVSFRKASCLQGVSTLDEKGSRCRVLLRGSLEDSDITGQRIGVRWVWGCSLALPLSCCVPLRQVNLRSFSSCLFLITGNPGLCLTGECQGGQLDRPAPSLSCLSMLIGTKAMASVCQAHCPAVRSSEGASEPSGGPEIPTIDCT